ncbi:MAG: hypothetical protein M1840_000225 [Geoglossum simile]|nr:MAG: hypothetical protein M1840_000225 [Geoglossum simile]
MAIENNTQDQSPPVPSAEEVEKTELEAQTNAKKQPWKDFFQPSEEFVKDGREMVVPLGDGVAEPGSNEGGF